jgi:hypothetical protein
MEIILNYVRVPFYLDTGAEVNYISKETYNRIPTLSKCDEVACMCNDQTATFLGKGRANFKRRNHTTTDVFYVAPKGSLNLLIYSTMQRVRMYIADAEVVNAGSQRNRWHSLSKLTQLLQWKVLSLTSSRRG